LLSPCDSLHAEHQARRDGGNKRIRLKLQKLSYLKGVVIRGSFFIPPTGNTDLRTARMSDKINGPLKFCKYRQGAT
jgi:hypothetical protein